MLEPTDDQHKALEALRGPFEPQQIGKLPKITCKDCSAKRCQSHTKTKCTVCGNYLTTAHVDLDFVGHAVVTDRLLAVDPLWTWEPLALELDNGPLIRTGGSEAELWIRLTVAGMTRIGVGTAPKGSFELSKQLIGDAIRNAAMRFGVALDLWTKQDLAEGAHDDMTPERSPDDPSTGTPPPVEPTDEVAIARTRSELMELYNGLDDETKAKVLDRLRTADIIKRKTAGSVGTVPPEHFDAVRRTLDAAHQSLVAQPPSGDEKGGEPPVSAPVGSPPPDDPPMSVDRLLTGITAYQAQLDLERRATWTAWLAEHTKGKTLEQLDEGTLWRAFAHIEDLATGNAPAAT